MSLGLLNWWGNFLEISNWDAMVEALRSNVKWVEIDVTPNQDDTEGYFTDLYLRDKDNVVAAWLSNSFHSSESRKQAGWDLEMEDELVKLRSMSMEMYEDDDWIANPVFCVSEPLFERDWMPYLQHWEGEWPFLPLAVTPTQNRIVCVDFYLGVEISKYLSTLFRKEWVVFDESDGKWMDVKP